MTNQIPFEDKRKAMVETPNGKLTFIIRNPDDFQPDKFDWDCSGPNYRKIGNHLLSHGLNVPTGEETAYLIRESYSKYKKNGPLNWVMNTLNCSRYSEGLWVFNKNLWTTKGVYVILDHNAEGLSKKEEVNDLEGKLTDGTILANKGIRISKDGNIRFCPIESIKKPNNKGGGWLGPEWYDEVYHTPESLAEDGFVIANFGIEGAKILGKAASKTSQGSAYVNLYNFHICEEPKLKVCALGAGGGKLNIHGNFTDDNTCIDDDYDDWELEYRARGYLSPESNEDLK